MDAKQYEVMLADAELRLRRLRVLYDHWFMGIERVEPQVQRHEVDRLLAALRKEPQRNTALRFRFNQLSQRYVSFITYWQRIGRQIEEGTYKRDVVRARMRVESSRSQPPAAEAPDGFELDVDVEIDEVDAEVDSALAALDSAAPPKPSAPAVPSRQSSGPPRDITPFAHPSSPAEVAPAAQGPVVPPLPQNPVPALRPAPAPPPRPPVRTVPQSVPRPHPSLAPPDRRSSRPPPPPPPPIGARPGAQPAAQAGNGPSAAQLENLYQRYVEARRNNHERTDNVKIETIAKTVGDMLPKLREKHAGKQIDFEVVVKDGRVALKPVAK